MPGISLYPLILLQLRDVPEEEDPDVIPDPVRAPQFGA